MIAGIALLAAIAGIGLCILFLDAADLNARAPVRPEPTPSAQEDAAQDKPALAQRADYLPDGVYYGKRLPVTEFRTKDGGVRDLNEDRGKKRVLLFWGSWCPYCDRVLQHAGEFERVLEEYASYELILIDKLDTGKGESIEKAEAFLVQSGIRFECLYDAGLRAYDAYGLKLIPTVLVLDEDGYLRAMTVEPLESGEALRALLSDAESGGAAATERFVRENMIGEDGGVYTTYADQNGDPPTGKDVLSESQGLVMEYALLTDDRQWFDQSYRYAKEKLRRDGVFCWYVTRDGKQADANALIDDLRIYRALRLADERWGGYAAEARALAKAIEGHNVTRGHLAGFYDFKQKRAGKTLPLFSLDLQALRMLAEDAQGFAALADEAEAILSGGYIGDAFALYYSSYDVGTKRYSQDSLNTSEALITLLHAVRAGVAKQESLDWLAERVARGTLAARYDVDGQPVQGFNYDSTAAYAIAALIGAEAGDARLYTNARNRMEKYHVTAQSALCGSFSDRADGSDIIAFDQLLPLLVYGGTGDIMFED